jgi:hypothetical protein
MTLARKRKKLCDQNGNVLPMSVRDAVEVLRPPSEWFGTGEDDHPTWRKLPWGEEFGRGLAEIIHLLNRNPPRARYVVKAARKGNTPGLTAAALREVVALLNRYADALEREGL